MSNSVIECLKELAAPYPPGDKTKAAIDRAARKCGLPYWRTFDLWYGKARRVESYERDAIADALAAKRELEAKNELHELRTRLARLEASLGTKDADFYRPQIDALLASSGRRS